jgi:hypothetical protein
MLLPSKEIRCARFIPSVMYVGTLVSRQYPASCRYNTVLIPGIGSALVGTPRVADSNTSTGSHPLLLDLV